MLCTPYGDSRAACEALRLARQPANYGVFRDESNRDWVGVLLWVQNLSDGCHRLIRLGGFPPP